MLKHFIIFSTVFLGTTALCSAAAPEKSKPQIVNGQFQGKKITGRLQKELTAVYNAGELTPDEVLFILGFSFQEQPNMFERFRKMNESEKAELIESFTGFKDIGYQLQTAILKHFNEGRLTAFDIKLLIAEGNNAPKDERTKSQEAMLDKILAKKNNAAQ